MSKIRSIRSLAPDVCPSCSQEGTFVVMDNRIECQHCGHVVRDDNERPVDPTPPRTPVSHDPTQYRVSYTITHRGGVENFVEAAYTTAIDHVKRQDWEGAIKNLRRCVDYRADFTDAHLWLGRLLPDPAERRDHITTILAHDPSHGEALRELMIIDGEIDPNAVENFDEYHMPEEREVSGSVAAKSKNVRCKSCGTPGMTFDEEEGMLICRSCGNRQEAKQNAYTGSSFSKALVKRRSQEVQWVVGSRMLQCESCGSKRTLSARQLIQTCPFCGSVHVVESDVLGSFQQPDGIIPFVVPRKNALSSVEAKLGGRMERIKGVFINNRVDRIEIEGVFLPFWMFDSVLDITRTTIDQRSSDATISPVNAYQQETFTEMRNNVAIPAVKSPAPKLLKKLGKFRLRTAVKYQPKHLAQYAAELYAIDFEDASLDAREIISDEMRQKYQQYSSEDIQVNIFTMVRQLNFSLILKPVWSVTIFEKDGDVRPALVNGQNGKVVLGRAQRPD